MTSNILTVKGTWARLKNPQEKPEGGDEMADWTIALIILIVLLLLVLLSLTVFYSKRGGKKLAEPKFEVFKDAKGEYRFRLIAPNGETIATGEGYVAKAGCMNGIESIKENAPKAKIVDLT